MLNYKAVDTTNLNKKERIDASFDCIFEIRNQEKFYYSERYDAKNTKNCKPKKVKLTKRSVSILENIQSFYRSYSIGDEITCVENLGVDKIDKERLIKELEYMKDSSDDCVYFSILSKYILKRECNLDLSFVQGFYEFENNMLAAMFLGKQSIGFHSWCLFKNAVIDTTFVAQQNTSLKKPLKNTVIIGEYDKEINLIGYIEKEDVAEKYLNDYLKINNLTLNEWLDMHMRCFKLK